MDENGISDRVIYGGLVLAAVLVVVFLALLFTLPQSTPPVATGAQCECPETCPADCDSDNCPCPVTPEPAKLVIEPEPGPQPAPEPEPVVVQPPEPLEPAPFIDFPPLEPVEPKHCACCQGCECGEKCNCKPGYRVCGKDCKCTALAVPYICEACGGTLYIGHAPGAKILPAYQCYRCPANPNGKKPLMYRADVKKAAPAPPAQPNWQPRFPRFFSGFTDLSNGQWCAGGT